MKHRGLALGALTFLLATFALLPAATVPAAAQGVWQIEGFVGVVDTDLDPLSEDPELGFRVVRDPGTRWSGEAQVLHLSGDGSRDFAIIAIDPPPPGITHIHIDFDAIAVDLSARLRLLPEDAPVQLHLLAGPGWGFVDSEVRIRPVVGPGMRLRGRGALGDSLTLHAGLALRIDLTERWYLRLDARSRYWDDRGGDETDVEGTFGVGFRL